MTPEESKQYKEAKTVCKLLEKKATCEGALAHIKGNKTIMLRWSIPHDAKDALGRSLPSFMSVAVTEEQALAILEAAQ